MTHRKSLSFIPMPYSLNGSLMTRWCLSQANLKAFPLKAAKAQQHTAKSYFTRLLHSKGILGVFLTVNVKRQ